MEGKDHSDGGVSFGS